MRSARSDKCLTREFYMIRHSRVCSYFFLRRSIICRLFSFNQRHLRTSNT